MNRYENAPLLQMSDRLPSPKTFIDNLMYATVIVKCSDNYSNDMRFGEKLGSGFLVNHKQVIYFVTCFHVVKDVGCFTFNVHLEKDSHPILALGEYTINVYDNDAKIDEENDVFAISLLHQNMKSLDPNFVKHKPFICFINSQSYFKKDDELGYASEVYLPGYPHGLMDEDNHMPILRSGTTASHPEIPFQGREKGLINVSCFPLDSGAPVAYYATSYMKRNTSHALDPRFIWLGMHMEGYSRDDLNSMDKEDTSSEDAPLSIGVYLKAKVIYDILEDIRE